MKTLMRSTRPVTIPTDRRAISTMIHISLLASCRRAPSNSSMLSGRLQIDLGAGVPDETPLDAPLDEPPLDVPSLDAPLDETSPRSDGRIGT
jgi:hypothetical protein